MTARSLNTNKKGLFGVVDGPTLLVYFLLLIIGWFNVYSSEYSDAQSNLLDLSTSHGKQIVNIGLSLFIGMIILLLDVRLYHSLGYVIFIAMLVICLITLFVGKVVNGAKGWLAIGGFQLQPAEFMKLATTLALGKYLSNYGIEMKNTRDYLYAMGFIFLPCALVLAQNDTGSALVFLSLFIVLYRQGLHAAFILIPLFIGTLSLMVLIFDKIAVLIAIGLIGALLYFLVRRSQRLILLLVMSVLLCSGMVFGVDLAYNKILKDYQRERIEVLIGKTIDQKGAGYNVHQSLIAIGAGSLTGRGYLKGTQTKLNFVPEQSTDFIFCTIGEEFGFLGTTILVSLFLFLLHRIIVIAERQKFVFNRCYAYGVASIIFIHFIINISMTLGLFPVIGIPLPFISYGGSAMLGFSIMLFILLKLDAANHSAY